MFSTLEFSKIRNALSFAENRSGLMKSFGFSPNYSMFIQFLGGEKKELSESKLKDILDSQGYEIVPVVIRKEDHELKEELNNIQNKNFNSFYDSLTQHSKQFMFKPKKVSKRKRGDASLILKSLQNSLSSDQSSRSNNGLLSDDSRIGIHQNSSDNERPKAFNI